MLVLIMKINIISNLFNSLNPNYYHLKGQYYRASYYNSIMNSTFSLDDDEKENIDSLSRIADDFLPFDRQRRTDILDPMYEKYKKGISERQVKSIVAKLCNYLKLELKHLEIKIFEINNYYKGHLGYFMPKGTIGGIVGISIHKYYDIKILVSIIVHECMHYFMHVHGLEISNGKNEAFTDFMGVYLGLGKYLINGYQQIHIINDNFISGFKKFAVGYLNDRQLAHLEARYQF